MDAGSSRAPHSRRGGTHLLEDGSSSGGTRNDSGRQRELKRKETMGKYVYQDKTAKSPSIGSSERKGVTGVQMSWPRRPHREATGDIPEAPASLCSEHRAPAAGEASAIVGWLTALGRKELLSPLPVYYVPSSYSPRHSVKELDHIQTPHLHFQPNRDRDITVMEKQCRESTIPSI